jgi:hypothetical protein
MEGTFAITAALLVLFSAMWDPRISIWMPLACLVAFGVYRLIVRNR